MTTTTRKPADKSAATTTAKPATKPAVATERETKPKNDEPKVRTEDDSNISDSLRRDRESASR